MRKDEFAYEIRRLFAGTGGEKFLTNERSIALWEFFGHEPVSRFKSAVTALIADGSRPTRNSINAALADAEEQEQAARISQNRGGSLADGIDGALAKPVAPPEYLNAIRRTMRGAAEGLSPSECADLLEQDALLDPSTDFAGWIASLRSRGASW